MSAEAIDKVWRNFPAGGSKLLVMLALADQCGQDRTCKVSFDDLRKKTRLPVAQVKRVIDSLITCRVLHEVASPYPGIRYEVAYRINFDALE